MSSSRLPGKILKDIAGKALIHRVWERAVSSNVFDEVIIATSNETSDDAVSIYCKSNDIPQYRGNLDDVLDRYHQAAISYNADIITRLTGDCPLVDPIVIRNAMDMHKNGDFDCVTNAVERTYPDGLDTEIFNFEILERINNETNSLFDREHVTPYLYKNTDKFKLGHLKQSKDLSRYRWTVDEPADLLFVREVYKEFGNNIFGMNEILDLLNKRPELLIKREPAKFF
ncbi:MAG: glycosyltransferase family protein [Kiritimatiellales bacterium]|nr:glycosyltransferase family protein [Kiritimatiellales bacterium]